MAKAEHRQPRRLKYWAQPSVRKIGAGHNVLGPYPPLSRIRGLRGPSSDFWFEDGDIVLKADAAQFRVHRSRLEQHSSVFRAMFRAMAKPSEGDELGDELVEDCRVMVLSDSAEDLKQMLSSLYDGRTAGPSQSFAYVSALLRLGKKYDMEWHYRTALEYLLPEFPSTLMEWKAHEHERRSGNFILPQPGLIFDIVNLASEMNIISVLPAAYYLLICGHSPSTVLSGALRKDYSRAKIPEQAQNACVIGRRRILNAMPIVTYGWLLSGLPAEACAFRDICSDTVRRCHHEFRWSFKASPPACFSGPGILDEFHLLCASCKAEATRLHFAGRLEMWQKLPKYFGFRSWDDILPEISSSSALTEAETKEIHVV